MSNDDDRSAGPIEDDDPVSAEALIWFVRRRDAAPSRLDQLRFSRWLGRSPEHAQAYAEIESLWSDLDAVEPAPVARSLGWPDQAKPALRWRRGAGGALAASLALLLAFNAPQLWVAAIADASTGRGETGALVLADGTEVALGADSAIDVAIDADRRRIRLLKGRAWFKVAHEARPFTVAWGDAQVLDIGTAFEVIERAGGGEVAVSDGLVELTADGGRALRLREGQAARFEQGQSRLIGSVPGAAAWREGRLQFVDARLSDVLDDLARFGASRAIVLDSDLARRQLTGVVDLADPSAAQEAILQRVGGRTRRIGPWLFVGPQ
jgi:transmembrane sensor